MNVLGAARGLDCNISDFICLCVYVYRCSQGSRRAWIGVYLIMHVCICMCTCVLVAAGLDCNRPNHTCLYMYVYMFSGKQKGLDWNICVAVCCSVLQCVAV